MSNIIKHSPDQSQAFTECINFTSEHSLMGYAGTGKTYLLSAIVKWYQDNDITVHVTASTHKAVAVLAEKLDCDVSTYHSLCGLRVSFDAGSGEMRLKLEGKSKIQSGSLWIIDEASMISWAELKHIRKAARAKSAKVLYVGDAYQLSPVKGSGSPALNQKSHSNLTTLHRQSNDNPLLESTQAYRHVLNGAPFPDVIASRDDNCGVQVLDRDAWEALRLTYYSAANPYNHVRSLYFTNDAVIEANKALHLHCTGRDVPHVGDTLIINSALERKSKLVFSTDEPVEVKSVTPTELHGLQGYDCLLSGQNEVEVFLPRKWDDAKELIKTVKKKAQALAKLCKEDESLDGDRRMAWREYYYLKNTLVDARYPYACTVHKSQGSTYEYAFVDLDDIGTCTVCNNIARLLYVAYSRPRKTVFVTGKLPERVYQYNQEVA